MEAIAKSDKVFKYLLIGIYSIIFITILHNLRTPYLWFDEAGQFFISKGLNHNSIPYSHPNGLLSVIENNKHYNLDPGGFSVLLHFWSYISNYHIWLRLLPFIFFIGVVCSFIFLSYKWTNNLNIALLIGVIPILTPVVLAMGFEVRAYSMESLGTMLTIVALEHFKKDVTNKYLLVWSCIFSFFMTSRYSEIVVVIIVSLYIVFLILNKTSGTLKQKLMSVIIYLLPLFVTFIYIYFFALIYQNKSLAPVAYLPYLKTDISLLLIPKNMLFLCLIVFLFIVYLFKNRIPFIKKYETLLFLTVIVNVSFIVLSFLNMYPWLPFSNRSISVLLLTLTCLSAILGELLLVLFKSTDILKYYLIAYILLFTLYLKKDNLLIRFYNNNVYVELERDSVPYNKIFVNSTESPSIKYMYEYGKFKSKKKNIYPKCFTFEKWHESIVNRSRLNLKDYDLFISPMKNVDDWQ